MISKKNYGSIKFQKKEKSAPAPAPTPVDPVVAGVATARADKSRYEQVANDFHLRELAIKNIEPMLDALDKFIPGVGSVSVDICVTPDDTRYRHYLKLNLTGDTAKEFIEWAIDRAYNHGN